MIRNHYIIGVMGSHEHAWEEYAEPLGQMLAWRGYRLLTGGGGGVMTSVAKAFTEAEGREGACIGIFPVAEYKGGRPSPEEFSNAYIEIPIVTPLDFRAANDAQPYSRNQVNIMSSDAVVILPGGHGTKNEVSLGLMMNKPVVLFGPDDAFDGFPESPLRTNNIDDVEQFLKQTFRGISEE